MQMCCHAGYVLSVMQDGGTGFTVHAPVPPRCLYQPRYLATSMCVPSTHTLQDLAHPWARAFDRNITEYVVSATDWLLQRAGRLLPSALAKSVRRGALQVANWATTPLLDHTSWCAGACTDLLP